MTPAVTPQPDSGLLSSQDFAAHVRQKYPGAYDHLSDDDLTQRVIQKYPAYKGRVNLASAPPAGPSRQMDSGEGPIARTLTSFETQLSKMPGNLVRTIGAKRWPIVDAQNWGELGEDIKSLNPVVSDDEGVDYGATAANLLPLAVDVRGGGIAESPLGRAAGRTRSLVRDVASSPRTGALAKLGAQEAFAKIPGVGHLVRRPSLWDYVRAARTSPEAPPPPSVKPPSVGNFKGPYTPEPAAPAQASPPPVRGFKGPKPRLVEQMGGKPVESITEPAAASSQPASPQPGSLLEQLRGYAAKIEAEGGHGEEFPEEPESTPITTNLNDDLTPALKASLAKVRAAKRIARPRVQ